MLFISKYMQNICLSKEHDRGLCNYVDFELVRFALNIVGKMMSWK